MRAPRRHRRASAPGVDPGDAYIEFMKRRLTSAADPRSHAEFLAEMRAKQAAGRLANPATAALLDRLERAVQVHSPVVVPTPPVHLPAPPSTDEQPEPEQQSPEDEQLRFEQRRRRHHRMDRPAVWAIR